MLLIKNVSISPDLRISSPETPFFRRFSRIVQESFSEFGETPDQGYAFRLEEKVNLSFSGH
ncbi:hypothetical protein [Methanosarcina barkeri]|uniref:hypothetical protein n=1 Tax=Methanosarcina barkeri TaxID=2208 RepID=UPI00064FAD12|nr:hypothetical protein [Methanosarcina barkeri]